MMMKDLKNVASGPTLVERPSKMVKVADASMIKLLTAAVTRGDGAFAPRIVPEPSVICGCTGSRTSPDSLLVAEAIREMMSNNRLLLTVRCGAAVGRSMSPSLPGALSIHGIAILVSTSMIVDRLVTITRSGCVRARGHARCSPPSPNLTP
ncbi:hypothetical protein EJ02DRAFT_454545 [Clathrospora elynae]|uniref:Uncharacterized protein n=1 Tax=Clathrospora elynae TaxID=706981 RepID=A0A6A5SRL8_9PLEO|nr:hypothetical protein EJ02DRAFT_454545 [Clathrospora elynae]